MTKVNGVDSTAVNQLLMAQNTNRWNALKQPNDASIFAPKIQENGINTNLGNNLLLFEIARLKEEIRELKGEKNENNPFERLTKRQTKNRGFFAEVGDVVAAPFKGLGRFFGGTKDN